MIAKIGDLARTQTMPLNRYHLLMQCRFKYHMLLNAITQKIAKEVLIDFLEFSIVEFQSDTSEITISLNLYDELLQSEFVVKSVLDLLKKSNNSERQIFLLLGEDEGEEKKWQESE